MILVIDYLARIWCAFLMGTLIGVDLSDNIQQLIMDTLAFDQDVRLNSLFYKGDEERVVVCCDMETLGEHKVLLDLVVSRLRSHPGVFSAGWEKQASPQEDF